MLWYFELVVLLLVTWVLAVRYRDFWKDLYSNFITYPGLFAIVVLLYLIIYAQVGTSFGIHNLFWSDLLLVRLSSSAAATIFLGLIGTIIYDLDPYPLRTARRIDAFIRREVTPQPHQVGIRYESYLREFLHVARWPFLVLLALPALLTDIFTRVPRVVPSVIPGWPLWNQWFESNAPAASLLGYLFGLAVWIAGIGLGVLIFEVLMLLSSKTHGLVARSPTRPWSRSPSRCIPGGSNARSGFRLTSASC